MGWFYLLSVKNWLVIIDINLQYFFIQLLLYDFIIHNQFLLFSMLLSMNLLLRLLLFKLFFHTFEQTFKISNECLIQSFILIIFLFMYFILHFINVNLCNVLILNVASKLVLKRFVIFCVFKWKFIAFLVNLLSLIII